MVFSFKNLLEYWRKQSYIHILIIPSYKWNDRVQTHRRTIMWYLYILDEIREDLPEEVMLQLSLRSWRLVPSLHGKQMGKLETVSDFILGGSKITADGDCSHEIKRCLLLERKIMTNLDSVFKSKDITLPTKVHLVKAMVFPVVMYGCENWTIKKSEC